MEAGREEDSERGGWKREGKTKGIAARANVS
jgi:hypothetical protein